METAESLYRRPATYLSQERITTQGRRLIG